MRRSLQILPLVLAAAVAPACENGAPWSDGEQTAAVEAPHDFGPTAAYARRLMFLGPGEPLPTAAILDFNSLSDSAGVRRGVRARLLAGQEWEPLMDAGWELEPMREPWRVLPGGALKVVVSDAGELAAVAYQGEPEVRLEPGALLGESSPDAGTQFVLRQATLRVDGTVLRGILLDSQLGRAVSPAAVPGALTTEDGERRGSSADDLEPVRTGRPTPIARAGAEAFLVNNSGYYAVVANSAGGDMAWVSHAGREGIHRGVSLQPTAWSTAEGDEVQRPSEWRVGGPESALRGELTAAATEVASLEDVGDLSALGYSLVSGWIEDGGVRRDVFGLIRHVR